MSKNIKATFQQHRNTKKGKPKTLKTQLECLIPKSLRQDFLQFAQNIKNPQTGDNYLSDNDFRIISEFLENRKSEEMAQSKGLTDKFYYSQVLFLLPEITDGDKSIFNDEEIQKIHKHVILKKKLRNEYLAEKLVNIPQYVEDGFLSERLLVAFEEDYAAELERKNELKKKKEDEEIAESKSDSEEDEEPAESKSDSKKATKLQKKLEKKTAELDSAKEAHAKEMAEMRREFEAERAELTEQIQALQKELEKTQSDLTTERNDHIILKRSHTSQNNRIDNLEAQLKELEKPEDNSEKIRLAAENLSLQKQLEEARAQIAKLEAQIKPLEGFLPIVEIITRTVGGQLESTLKQTLQPFSTRLSNLEKMVRGQQARISQETAPQMPKTEKQKTQKASKMDKREYVLRNLENQGFSKAEINFLCSQRVIFYGERRSDYGSFQSFWKVLNPKSSFYDIEKHNGHEINAKILSNKFDFVILTLNRSHDHDQHITEFGNPKLIDFAHKNTNTRIDAVQQILTQRVKN